MPVWLIFTFVFSGGTFVQLGLLIVMLSNERLRLLIPHAYSIAGLSTTPFLFMSGVLRGDPFPCVCAGVLVYFYLRMINRNKPRRKRVRKLIGEKSRAARDKLVATMPSTPPLPAGA